MDGSFESFQKIHCENRQNFEFRSNLRSKTVLSFSIHAWFFLNIALHLEILSYIVPNIHLQKFFKVNNYLFKA